MDTGIVVDSLVNKQQVRTCSQSPVHNVCIYFPIIAIQSTGHGGAVCKSRGACAH